MRIAVISDIHAYEDGGGGPKPSFLNTRLPEDQPARHPFAGLMQLIGGDGTIRADILVCCGDIGDKASPAGIDWAWKWLDRIRVELGASRTFATSGNHDLDSRYLYTDHDAKGVLQALNPLYPLDDADANDRYWSRNFAVELANDCRIVTLNSAAYHGVDDEWEHGRVSARTLTRLQQALVDSPNQLANVLICHHHPFRLGDIDLDDYSEMKGGDALLALLGSGAFGRWLIIHGHRHWPSLSYAPGGATSPIVFAAGSFSAVLYPELGTRARNQFYILDLPISDYPAMGLGLVGEFHAWDWSSNVGWIPAHEGSGLPHRGGFGTRDGGDLIAAQIADQFTATTDPFLSWEDVCAQSPRVRFLLPTDIAMCTRALEEEYGINVLTRDGYPMQIGTP